MHYNDLKHALYNTHFCFFICFALFRWMQSESIRFTCVQWYVKIQQVRASTSKHIMIYDDIWWYISIARALENWLTQETTREPRGRRIREGSVLNRPLLALPGLYQVVQILWISMIFDDIWWYLNIGDVCIYLMMFSHVYKLLRYVCQCLYTHAYPCTVNKSMYIHVYPSFVKPLVPLASICILVTFFLHCFILYYSMLIHFCASWFINLHPFMLPGSIAARGDRTRGWLTLGRFWYGPVGFKSFCAHYITLHHITACPQWVYMFLSYPLIWSLHPPWLYPNKCLMFWDLQNAPASFFEGILYTPNRGETSLPFASWLVHIISKNHGKRKAYCRLFLTNKNQFMNRNQFL